MWLWGFCGEKIIIGIDEMGIILQVSARFPFLSVLITGEEWKTVPKVFIWEEMWLQQDEHSPECVRSSSCCPAQCLQIPHFPEILNEGIYYSIKKNGSHIVGLFPSRLNQPILAASAPGKGLHQLEGVLTNYYAP